ncbi:spindle pole body docking protein Cut11 [Schizosaccharomyces cryophilus OY26]|uniref:Spindle pole body docking protein Cut11 n=1 Tax=Schizosaccharomyces cryophilus (strain OY26 / ATCC MYA-4695 / CBS 11777 / NBRC 106824 / NRRL Y48691) TaxID=653667 RepID=S9XI59_SCHCR|nr:spindle pole body docking protein Cut11 [Schizosaccharomyces cryophilus OY26]EPY53326.1 spindle pole body docking protein Cut11 [Schizosaccharomyces cryophilus OY26]
MVALRTSFLNGSKTKAVRYHTILRPILQQRFLRASLALYCLCCVTSYWLASGSIFSLKLIFGSFFKGILCFLFVFPYFVMLKSRMTTTKNVHSSLAKDLMTSFSPRSFFPVYISFVVSVGILTIAYVQGHASSARLQWVTSARMYELPRLNERFVYMMFIAAMMAFASACEHLYFGRDTPEQPVLQIPFFVYVKQNIPSMFKFSVIKSLACGFASPIIYAIFRSSIWKTFLIFTKCFHRLAASKALPRWPVNLGLLFHSLWMTFLINISLNMALLIFRIFLYAGPVVRSRFISMRSNDPNGTLLDGIKTRNKPLTQCIASQELYLICSKDPKRIQSILQDIDRKTSVWQEILNYTLMLCESLSTSLQQSSVTKKSSATETAQSSSRLKNGSATEAFNTIPLKEENVFASSSSQRSRLLEKVKKHGNFSSPDVSQNSFLESLVPASIRKQFSKYPSVIYRTSLFNIFRKTLDRKNAAVLSNPWLLEIHITSLSLLVLKSLQYDTYGVVARDISDILTVYCDTYDKLIAYKRNPPIHASDVFASERTHDFDDMDRIIACLRDGIVEITEKFQDFFLQLNIPTKVERRCWVLYRGRNSTT